VTLIIPSAALSGLMDVSIRRAGACPRHALNKLHPWLKRATDIGAILQKNDRAAILQQLPGTFFISFDRPDG
jgi:hypothetical protein